MTLATCCSLILLALASPSLAQDDSAPQTTAEQALADAEQWFAEGLRVQAEDPIAAIAAFERAAAGYRDVRERFGVRNHRLEVNLANASLLAADPGRAMLAYLRAERLNPTSSSVRRSIEYLRARTGMTFEPSISQRMTSAALAWRGMISRSLLVWIMIAGYAAVWLIASARILGIKLKPWVAAPPAALAAIAMVLLFAEQVLLLDTSRAVIVSPVGAEARLGPDAGVYELAFETRLPAGIECVILEQRDNWARVRLIDGRDCWVPLAAIERV